MSGDDLNLEMQTASVRAGSLHGIVPVDPQPRHLSEELVAAYLRRLAVAPDTVASPTLEALRALQIAHCDRIAYENLDLYSDEGGPLPPPPLEPVSSVERVAVRQRGGYCFLLVDAFAALLSTLGFRVSMHTAGVGEDPLPREKWGK